MRSAIAALQRYVDYLSDTYRAHAKPLGVLRILFAAYIILVPIDYTWVAKVPAEFFNPPPGLPSLFSGPPPLEMLVALEVFRAVVAVWLAIGWKTMAASVTLTVTLLVGSAIVHSFSKIDHFILFELVPVALAAAGWGSAFSLDARRRKRTNGFPILLWAMVVAFALFTAALPKIMSEWLSPSHHGSLAFVAKDVVDGDKVGPLAEFLVGLDAGWMWKLLDFVTVFAEAWLILAFLVPGLFRLGILLISFFHIGVYLSLGIDFSLYVFVYAVFFCLPPKQWLPEVRWFHKRRVDEGPMLRAAGPVGHQSESADA